MAPISVANHSQFLAIGLGDCSRTEFGFGPCGNGLKPLVDCLVHMVGRRFIDIHLFTGCQLSFYCPSTGRGRQPIRFAQLVENISRSGQWFVDCCGRCDMDSDGATVL